MNSSSPAQVPGLQVVASAGKAIPKRTVEARDIAPRICQEIAAEFHVVKSSRILAKKYKLPRHVISDILDLHPRMEPQSERLSAINIFERRRA